MSTKEFRCEFVSSSAAGDCCQVMFEEASEGDGVYVLIQGQFEFPNRGKRYVETSDPDLCGHYVIQNAQLTRNRFRFSYGAGPTKHVTVSRLVMNFNRRVTLPTEKGEPNNALHHDRDTANAAPSSQDRFLTFSDCFSCRDVVSERRPCPNYVQFHNGCYSRCQRH